MCDRPGGVCDRPGGVCDRPGGVCERPEGGGGQTDKQLSALDLKKPSGLGKRHQLRRETRGYHIYK